MADASGKFPGEPSRPQEKVHTAKKPGRVLRSCAAAAAVIVLLCGTAYAFGWNIFQALADWTAETFQFLTGAELKMADYGVFDRLYKNVSMETDIPVVPRWAPEGTKEVEQPRVSERSDKLELLEHSLLKKSYFRFALPSMMVFLKTMIRYIKKMMKLLTPMKLGELLIIL